jgi:glycosyltransferase involved in cell wall biosynthesis
VLFLGRIGEEKGVKTLIDAWRSLPELPLKIVGSGPDEEKYKRLVQTLNLRNVEFLGFRPHEECMDLLDRARFLVMPSLCYETFGLSIVEAFSHGKPVIASNLGAMADIVQDGVTGLLFSPNDSEQLAEKARWLWNNVEEYETMGQNARKEYMAKYTPEKNYEMLMDIYEKAVEFHGGRKQ